MKILLEDIEVGEVVVLVVAVALGVAHTNERKVVLAHLVQAHRRLSER